MVAGESAMPPAPGVDSHSITRFHERMLADPGWPQNSSSLSMAGVWRWVAANHRYNTLLWNEEDKARRIDVDAGEIAACKRLIDQYNQKRNDAVEAMDEAILAAIRSGFGRQSHPWKARLNSESAGSMIDRLSILCLKIHHMGEQTRRTDASARHIAECSGKLYRLMAQRLDLAACFDQLLADAREGRAYFKVYRQFKMYNDPTLNPYLYGKVGRAGTEKGAP